VNELVILLSVIIVRVAELSDFRLIFVGCFCLNLEIFSQLFNLDFCSFKILLELFLDLLHFFLLDLFLVRVNFSNKSVGFQEFVSETVVFLLQVSLFFQRRFRNTVEFKLNLCNLVFVVVRLLITLVLEFIDAATLGV